MQTGVGAVPPLGVWPGGIGEHGGRPEPTMDMGAVGNSLVHMASLPLDANVLFMTVMATNMPFVGRG